jgi:hypothetical protein
VNEALPANRLDCALNARNLQKEDCFIAGRIVFNLLFFEAEERCAGVELGMVAGLLAG